MDEWLQWLILAALKLTAGVALGVVVLTVTAVSVVLLAIWQLMSWLESERK